MSQEINWAGNYAYRARTIHQPESVDEVRAIVRGGGQVRGLGTRHTFNDIADTAELVSLQAIDPDITIDREAMTVSAGAGVRYGILAQVLEEAGFALHNMGSLPHISVGGATATATHGSGDAHGNLATAVCGIELVTADGEIVTAHAGDANFAGMVVHLGALGIATRLTFDIQRTYQVYQEVLEQLPWDELTGGFDDIFGSAYSVSVFTKYAELADVLWVKHRLEPGQEPRPGRQWGAVPATRDRHPLAELSGDACTGQLLAPGAWCDRLPHFRLDKVPASGEEIQTEYMVDRAVAVDVIAALREFEPEMRDLLMVSEIRTIAADDLWLSTAYGRETVAFHFSWYRDQAGVDALLPRLEARLDEFTPRPHWGKAFALGADVLAGRYERMAEFRALADRLDPEGKFRNSYLRRTVFG